MRRNRYGEIVAGIAQSWAHSSDYRTWNFTIAEAARFHDGKAVQATDVEGAWVRFIKEDYTGEVADSWLNPLFSIDGAVSCRRGDTNSVSGIHVLDNRHLRVVLKVPDAEFLIKLTGPNAWINQTGSHRWIRISSYRHRSLPSSLPPIGGNTNQGECHSRMGGKPYLDDITFRYYGEIRQALFDFESGILDALHVPLTETPRRKDNDSNEILIQTDAAVGVYLQHMSGESEPAEWYDVLKYALDADALLRLQYGAPATRATVTLSPRHYDPIKARRRLKNVSTIQLISAALPDNTGNEIAARLQRNFLSQIGLQISLVNTDSVSLQNVLSDGGTSLALLSIPLPQGTDAAIDWFNHANTLIPLYLLPSNFLCQSHLRNLNIGWGGVVAFDQIWLAKR